MMQQMERAIALNPRNAAALNYLGYSYAEMGVRLDEAESLIRRALALDPDDGFYVDSLGWVYYQRGDYRRAVEQLERAVELAGDDPTVAEHLGDAYERDKRPDAALRVYRDALAHAKDESQVARLKGKIQTLEAAAHADQSRL
jgi:Flp pilus assembly protein TadD